MKRGNLSRKIMEGGALESQAIDIPSLVCLADILHALQHSLQLNFGSVVLATHRIYRTQANMLHSSRLDPTLNLTLLCRRQAALLF